MNLITQIIVVTWNNLIKTYMEFRKVFLELDKKYNISIKMKDLNIWCYWYCYGGGGNGHLRY